MRKCKKCNQEKPLIEFIKNKNSKEGYANTCKFCQNEYSKKWKQVNSSELSKKRRIRYSETKGIEVKERELKRKLLHPLRVRCQLLRRGMINRAKTKKIAFDNTYFTVEYLIDRIIKNNKCQCCGKELDISYKENRKFNDNSPSIDRVIPKLGYIKNNVAILCWRCNKHKQDSTAKELRMIADFMDVWGNEVDSSVTL
jgi:hypothetical protein